MSNTKTFVWGILEKGREVLCVLPDRDAWTFLGGEIVDEDNHAVDALNRIVKNEFVLKGDGRVTILEVEEEPYDFITDFNQSEYRIDIFFKVKLEGAIRSRSNCPTLWLTRPELHTLYWESKHNKVVTSLVDRAPAIEMRRAVQLIEVGSEEV